MFPIRDDQPRYSTPVVNYFIIGLNTLVFLFELSVQGQGPRAFEAFVFQFGVVPEHFARALAGSTYYPIPATLLTILTSMFLHGGWLHIISNIECPADDSDLDVFAWRLAAHHFQHVVLVDFWGQY